MVLEELFTQACNDEITKILLHQRRSFLYPDIGEVTRYANYEFDCHFNHSHALKGKFTIAKDQTSTAEILEVIAASYIGEDIHHVSFGVFDYRTPRKQFDSKKVLDFTVFSKQKLFIDLDEVQTEWILCNPDLYKEILKVFSVGDQYERIIQSIAQEEKLWRRSLFTEDAKISPERLKEVYALLSEEEMSVQIQAGPDHSSVNVSRTTDTSGHFCLSGRTMHVSKYYDWQKVPRSGFEELEQVSELLGYPVADTTFYRNSGFLNIGTIRYFVDSNREIFDQGDVELYADGDHPFFEGKRHFNETEIVALKELYQQAMGARDEVFAKQHAQYQKMLSHGPHKTTEPERLHELYQRASFRGFLQGYQKIPWTRTCDPMEGYRRDIDFQSGYSKGLQLRLPQEESKTKERSFFSSLWKYFSS
jgi:hypothetical protein